MSPQRSPATRSRWPAPVAATLALVLSSCVLAVQPVIPDGDGVFEPALLGTWAVTGDPDTAVVTRAGETDYLITYNDGRGRTAQFSGRLGWLGDRRVLEVRPLLPDLGREDPTRTFVLRTRLLFFVTIHRGEVRTVQLRTDSLRALLGRGTPWTPHLAQVDHDGDGDDHLLLTGTTTELRTFLASYLKQPGVLGDRDAWRAVPAR